jgi:hypothetical protein
MRSTIEADDWDEVTLPPTDSGGWPLAAFSLVVAAGELLEAEVEVGAVNEPPAPVPGEEERPRVWPAPGEVVAWPLGEPPFSSSTPTTIRASSASPTSTTTNFEVFFSMRAFPFTSFPDYLGIASLRALARLVRTHG